MKFTLREFARKIREHLKTAKHTLELTKHLEKLAADAYAVPKLYRNSWEYLRPFIYGLLLARQLVSI